MNTPVSARTDYFLSPRKALLATIVAFTVWQATRIVFSSGLALHHDEVNFLIESLRLPAFGKPTGYSHGPLVYELLAVMEIGWYAAARLVGTVRTPVDHLANLLGAMGPHLKLGRMLALSAGVLSLVQVYRLGRHFAGEWAGVLATLLCASSLTFAVFTATIKDDVFFWLFQLTATDLMWRASPTENRRPFLAGLAIGAGFAAKYFAIFWVALALLPLVRYPRARTTVAVRQGVMMMTGAGIGVVVFFPFLIWDLPGVSVVLRGLFRTNPVPTALAFEPYLFVHLPRLLGPVVGVTALVELVIRCRQEPRGAVLLVVPATLLLVSLGVRGGYTMAYYIFSVAIVGFVLASAFAARVAARLEGRVRAVPFLVLGAIALFDPAYLPSMAKYGLLVTGPDTRLLAAAWIEASVPAGECIVANGGVAGWNHFGPPIAPTEITRVSGSGLYTAAERVALARRPGPHYRLHLVDGFPLPSNVPADCQWIVEARFGALSMLELTWLNWGAGAEQLFGRTQAPVGFTPVAEIRAFPEPHIFMYPFMSVLDLDELRSISFARMRRERRLGVSFVIYRRARDGS